MSLNRLYLTFCNIKVSFSITLSSFIVTIVKLEHLSSPTSYLGITCKVRTGKQNIPFLFLVTDNCSHFSSDELIKPRQRYKKIFILSIVLNKKVLILFSTMDKMNKKRQRAICHDDKCKRIHHSFIVTIRYIDYNSCNYSVHPYCHELLR